MDVSLPGELSNVTLGHLNFTANCSNIQIGYDVWLNDFTWQEPSPGNLTEDDTDGPDDYSDFWTNGTSPEFLGFWRGALGTVLPKTYLTYTDAQIATWTNHTEFYDFFNDNVDTWPLPSLIDELSNSLSESGGCSVNASANQQGNTNYAFYQQACMIQYCCESGLSFGQEDSADPYPYFTNWTTQDACAFDTCTQANQGNPDLGGIGVIAAYFIEASLLFLTLIFFLIMGLDDWRLAVTKKQKVEFVGQHERAVKAAAGSFVDNAVFFSFAVNFASIIFNYKDEPLLYEDKLGQTSSLLAIDAPVAVLLLCYKVIDRRGLRIFMVFLAALMTFIIQFMFRRAKSFNPGTSLCFAWDDYVQSLFVQRFIAKAVWCGLLVVYIAWASAEYFVPVLGSCLRRRRPDTRPAVSRSWWPRQWQKLKASDIARLAVLLHERVPWQRIIAFCLGAYGMFLIAIDVRFILFLRHQEKSISGTYDEDTWGYGQILAVFVWVPPVVEYFYIFGFQRGWWGRADKNSEEIRHEREDYEPVQRPPEYQPNKDDMSHEMTRYES